jgi:arylsulfatase B
LRASAAIDAAHEKMMSSRNKLFAAALFCAVAATTVSIRAAERKPNIVYIVADDLGWKDVGFNGATDIKTPNLDKLAATGARLEQFYAQPMCTPTRAALLTGRYPNHYGLQTIVIPSVSSYGLATDEWLLPQGLKEAGYQTAIIGKWHLGHGDKKYWPRQRGFDYQYGPLIGELDYFTHEEHGVLDWYRDNKQVKENGYTTTLLGNDAVKYINERNASTPFFLYLAFNAPHTPYQAPQEYIDRYKNIEEPTRRNCAIIRSSSFKATTAEPATQCSAASWPICLRSRSLVTTVPIGKAKARYMKAERASVLWPTGQVTSPLASL